MTAQARVSSQQQDEAVRYLRLGQAQVEQGKTLQAIESIEKGLELDPQNPQLYYFLGSIRYQQSEYKPAVKQFRKAIKLNPYYTDAHNYLGLVYRDTGEYDKALEEFGLALKDKAYRTPERIHFNIGHLYLARGMFNEAIASFQKATALNPSYTRGHLGLGTAYTRAGEKVLAEKELRKVMALEPNSPEAEEARQMLDRKVKSAGS